MLHSPLLIPALLVLGMLVFLALMIFLPMLEKYDQSSWTLLAKQYELKGEFEGGPFLLMGGGNWDYNRMCNVGANDEGLYLSFMAGPDLLIPWGDIEFERVKVAGFKFLEVHVSKVPEANVTVCASLEEQLKQKAGSLWPGVKENEDQSV